MATPRENLNAALANATARLAELDAVPLDQRAMLTYSDGNQQFSWGEYRASISTQIKDTLAMLQTMQAVEGPFTVVGGGGWW